MAYDEPLSVFEPYWTGHRERLRLRMELEGWDALKPYEMVEMILYYAVPQQDQTDVARALVERFGTFGGVMRATYAELAQVPGMTRSMARWMAATGRLVCAYGEAVMADGERLFRYYDVVGYLSRNCRNVPAPQTWVLYTDFDDNLLYRSALCPTLAWFETEYARQLVTEAIALSAKHLILVLFIGDLPLTPDPEDLLHLKEIAYTLCAAKVELLDCVLAGNAGYYSMHMNGDLTPVRAVYESMALHEHYCDEDIEQID